MTDANPPQPETTTQPPAQPKTSGLAIAALVLAFIPCVNIVGLILAIIALTQINARKNELKGSGLAIGAIVITPLWLVVAILASIAIPNFLRFQTRARQSEAKTNLKAIFTAEKSLYAETGNAPTTFDASGWRPERGHIYTYYLADDVIPSDRAGPHALPPGFESYVIPEEGRFVAIAVGNVDGDETLDVWTINDENLLENPVNDVDN